MLKDVFSKRKLLVFFRLGTSDIHIRAHLSAYDFCTFKCKHKYINISIFNFIDVGTHIHIRVGSRYSILLHSTGLRPGPGTIVNKLSQSVCGCNGEIVWQIKAVTFLLSCYYYDYSDLKQKKQVSHKTHLKSYYTL